MGLLKITIQIRCLRHLFIIVVLLLASVLVQANTVKKVAGAIAQQLDRKAITTAIESSSVKFSSAKAKMSIFKNDADAVSLYQTVQESKTGGTILREVLLEPKDKPNSTWSFEMPPTKSEDGLSFKLKQTYKDVARGGDNLISSVKSYLLDSSSGIRRTTQIHKSRNPSKALIEHTGEASPEYISISSSPDGKPPFYGSISATQIDTESFNAVTPNRKPIKPHLVSGVMTMEPKLAVGEGVVDIQITDSLDRVVFITDKGRSLTYHIPKEKLPKSGLLTEPIIAEGVLVPSFRERVLKSVKFDSTPTSSSGSKGIQLNFDPPAGAQ